MKDHPWKTPPPRIVFDSDDHRRRYQRAARLNDMAQLVKDCARYGGPRDAAHARRVAYAQHCIDHWEAYLAGEIEPPTGRKAG